MLLAPVIASHDVPGSELSAGRVLVVERSETARLAIAGELRRAGFDVVEVASDQAALDIVTFANPDLILLALDHSAARATEMCRLLKATTGTLLPVLQLATGEWSAESRATALQAGMDGYLPRRPAPDELRATVGALIRVRRHEESRVSEASVNALLVDALDALADHVALLGCDSRVIAVNRAWVAFAADNGYEGGGTGIGDFYCEVCERARGAGSEEAQAAEVGIWSVLDGSTELFELDYPCHSPTEERWFRMSVRPVARQGNVAAIVTHVARTREVLASRAEAAALSVALADRARLEATLAALPVGVWLSDKNGKLTHTNPEAQRVWGGEAPLVESPDEYGVYRAWRPNTGEPLLAHEWPLARTLLTGKVVHDEIYEIGRFDGRRGFAAFASAPIIDSDGTMVGGLVVSTDVTDRQAELRERQRIVAELVVERTRLADVFQRAPSFVAVLTGKSHIFELANPAFDALIDHRDLIGRTLLDAIPELQEQGFASLMDDVWATGEPFVGRQQPVTFGRVTGQPEQRYLDIVIQRLDDIDGGHSVVAHGVDVTAQMEALDKVRRTKEQLREQFQKLPVPTYLWEVAGDDFLLVDCNELAKRGLGDGTRIEAGRTASALFPGTEDIVADGRRCLRENIVIRRTVEVKEGRRQRRRYFDLTIGPQHPGRVLLHAVDATVRTELEAQLRQAQKMDAVGQLAGGVAHDFNNLLTVIGAHSDFLLESLEADDPQRQDAEEIRKAGHRAAALTHQLLAFSRKQLLKPTLLDVNAIITDTRNMLARLLGEDIAIVMSLADELDDVVADASQLNQVIVNLAVNARDAMPQGGQLTFTTSNVRVDSGSGRAHRGVAPGAYVVIEVRDTGVGMDSAVQARLFEPFFTTKEPGKGTGLGLATVYGIVKQSAGYIIVKSALHLGSTFCVYLPSVAGDSAGAESVTDEKIPARGRETVLVVEDEPAVRAIARRVLLRQGYRVLEAENGAEALRVAEKFTDPIHLVVSDAVMPEMGGAEVVRQLQAARAGIKVVIMSGYTDDDVVRRGIVSSAVPFIQKPFTPQAFARAVRDALDAV